MLWLVETLGEELAAGLVGLIVGAVFGVAAQRSRFCLRASAVEFARLQMGPRMSVWLLTFSTALIWTQSAELTGIISTANSRIMSVTGSYSGAILGGLIFGGGMILARGCSGRMLVLAATGNLRSVMNGLVFAVFAQMALAGWLAGAPAQLSGRAVGDAGWAQRLFAALAEPAAVDRAWYWCACGGHGAGAGAAQSARVGAVIHGLGRGVCHRAGLDHDVISVAGQL